MKPTKFIGALLTAFVVIFASGCSKDLETSELTLDLTQSATINAYFYAELDKTKDGLELVPNGTPVIVSIANKEFNSDADGNRLDTAFVQNGYITITVPTTPKGADVSFHPAEFTHNQVQPYGSNSQSVPKIYSLTTPGKVAKILPGETRTLQVEYDKVETLMNYTEKVTRKFQGFAQFDANAGTIKLPSELDLVVFTANWSTTARTGTDGKFEVEVPINQKITIRFERPKTTYDSNGDPENFKHRFTYNGPANGFSETSMVSQSITFNSELWE